MQSLIGKVSHGHRISCFDFVDVVGEFDSMYDANVGRKFSVSDGESGDGLRVPAVGPGGAVVLYYVLNVLDNLAVGNSRGAARPNRGGSKMVRS